MKFEQLLQAGIYCSDLEVANSHFESIGVTDPTGFLHLKSSLMTLANLCDFEATVRQTYQEHPEPSVIIKPLRKNLEFSKYLRNKFIGHIHPELIAKAIEWQPTLHHVAKNMEHPKATLVVNLWLLETAINTYVEADGTHKIFNGDTDLMYPPDWHRFLDFFATTIRGGIEYLKLLRTIWAPIVYPITPDPFDLELALKAGQTEFKFLTK